MTRRVDPVEYEVQCSAPVGDHQCPNVGRFDWGGEKYCGQHYPPNVEQRKRLKDRDAADAMKRLSADLQLDDLYAELGDMLVAEDYAGIALRRDRLIELRRIAGGDQK